MTPEPRTYKVRYRLHLGGSDGSCDDLFTIVLAYDAKDAAFQGMIEPERYVKANAAYAYTYLLGVEPWTEKCVKAEKGGPQ